MDSLRGKVAIVGAADTPVGKLPQFSPTGLCIDAARRAMADANITKDKIDGLITCNSMAEPYMYHAEAMAEYLQIDPSLLFFERVVPARRLRDKKCIHTSKGISYCTFGRDEIILKIQGP